MILIDEQFEISENQEKKIAASRMLTDTIAKRKSNECPNVIIFSKLHDDN